MTRTKQTTIRTAAAPPQLQVSAKKKKTKKTKKVVDEDRVVYTSTFGKCSCCLVNLGKWGKPLGYTNGFRGAGTNGHTCPVACIRTNVDNVLDMRRQHDGGMFTYGFSPVTLQSTLTSGDVLIWANYLGHHMGSMRVIDGKLNCIIDWADKDFAGEWYGDIIKKNATILFTAAVEASKK